jgi:hypothetical protein
MKPNFRNLVVAATLACLPMLSGCGKGSPTAPQVEAPQPAVTEYADVSVNLVRVTAIADGDLIEGPGDFAYVARVTDGARVRERSGDVALETGSSFAINSPITYRVPLRQNYNIEVSFRATEWDANILGAVYADARMDNLVEKRVHTDASASSGFNDGERWITLGSGELQLRLVYTITSVPVVP